MNHSDPILRRVHACVLARIPAILWSAPGTGKTARVMSYARARQLHIERWLLSRCEPIDLKPRVYHEGRVVVTSAPEVERLHKAGGGILFKDELNRATREVEGAALDLIDNPPPNVSVIAACNPQTRGQAARHLGSAAANRFCHLDVSVDAAAWANARVGGWPDSGDDYVVPDHAQVDACQAKVDAILSTFIRRAGEKILEDEPADPIKAGRPWPSARTWEYVAKLHAMALALDLPTDDVIALVQGCVGNGPGTMYLTFVDETAGLPDPEEWLADASVYSPDPARLDRTIVALTGVVSAVERHATDDRWKAAWGLVGMCSAPDMTDIGPAIVAGTMLVEAYTRLCKRDSGIVKRLKAPGLVMPSRIAHILVPVGGK